MSDSCGMKCVFNKCQSNIAGRGCAGCSCYSVQHGFKCMGIHEAETTGFDLRHTVQQCGDKKYPGATNNGLIDSWQIYYYHKSNPESISAQKTGADLYSWNFAGVVYQDAYALQKAATAKLSWKWSIVGGMTGVAPSKEVSFSAAKEAFKKWLESKPSYLDHNIIEYKEPKTPEQKAESAAVFEATFGHTEESTPEYVDEYEEVIPTPVDSFDEEALMSTAVSNVQLLPTTEDEWQKLEAKVFNEAIQKPSFEIVDVLPGVLHIKGFLSHDRQVEALDNIKAQLAGKWTTPPNSSGKIKIACYGEWWMPGIGYGDPRVSWTKTIPVYGMDGELESTSKIESFDVPSWLQNVWFTALDRPRFTPADAKPPHTAVVNYYALDAVLKPHVDTSEDAGVVVAGRPIITMSLGSAAIFAVGGLRQTDPYTDVEVRSGDLIIMYGEGRNRFHGIRRIIPGTSPLEMKSECRISVTMREVH